METMTNSSDENEKQLSRMKTKEKIIFHSLEYLSQTDEKDVEFISLIVPSRGRLTRSRSNEALLSNDSFLHGLGRSLGLSRREGKSSERPWKILVEPWTDEKRMKKS